MTPKNMSAGSLPANARLSPGERLGATAAVIWRAILCAARDTRLAFRTVGDGWLSTFGAVIGITVGIHYPKRVDAMPLQTEQSKIVHCRLPCRP